MLRESYEVLEIIPYDFDMTLIDTYGLYPLVHFTPVLIGIYIGLKCLNKVTSMFPSKIQYNRNRDLIFVDKINMMGKPKTRIYEVDHLTRTLPFLKS